jgi:predicted TIM-barrel fold metal-dependent hydrolase
MSIDFWDPHFHIWDISENTKSSHDSQQLFAPENKPIYACYDYENDMQYKDNSFRHTGGAFIEAMSVCHIDSFGSKYENFCINETSWTSNELKKSPKQYVLISSAPLESPNLNKILSKLSNYPFVCGIRQILNHNPSWPRNSVIGDLLDNEKWEKGFSMLGNYNFSFELQLNPSQYHKALNIIKDYPDTKVIINHLGTPKLDDIKNSKNLFWESMKEFSKYNNVFIKISMLSYIMKDWEDSEIVNDAVHRIIEIFGINNCFFASNFPVESNLGWDINRLLDAFKNIASNYEIDEIKKLFSINAMSAYNVKIIP